MIDFVSYESSASAYLEYLLPLLFELFQRFLKIGAAFTGGGILSPAAPSFIPLNGDREQ
jgi:hypothetical protein